MFNESSFKESNEESLVNNLEKTNLGNNTKVIINNSKLKEHAGISAPSSSISKKRKLPTLDEEELNRKELKYKFKLPLDIIYNKFINNEPVFSLEFFDFLFLYINTDDILPKSLNEEGSFIFTLSAFWVLLIDNKLQGILIQEEKNDIFISLFNNASEYMIDNKLTLIDFVVKYIEANFTTRDILERVNFNPLLKNKISNVYDLSKNDYKYLIKNPEFFNTLVTNYSFNSNKKMKISNTNNNSNLVKNSRKKSKSKEETNFEMEEENNNLVQNDNLNTNINKNKNKNSNEKKIFDQSPSNNEVNKSFSLSFSSSKQSFQVNINYPIEEIVNNLNESINQIEVDHHYNNNNSEKKNEILLDLEEFINSNVKPIPEENLEDDETNTNFINARLNVGKKSKEKKNNFMINVNKSLTYYGRGRPDTSTRHDLNKLKKEIMNSYNLTATTYNFQVERSVKIRKENSYDRADSFSYTVLPRDKKRLSFVNNFQQFNQEIEPEEVIVSFKNEEIEEIEESTKTRTNEKNINNISLVKNKKEIIKKKSKSVKVKSKSRAKKQKNE